ncbi:MAG: ATP-dependent DNA helicase RecG [Candidatus Moranbacteria bacterium GW2011_GWD2_36_12]|nr:MAG: ATP-dependent DNA helicase RecG [Candidatus Moranbacteria bacterium GW2011_GWD2_36_12]KKQ04544.1 MAG: ATP-dependent DNA helicase RecG [Candidatus Moranbacteria bacterium GW2011_GWE2_36_40]
MDFLKMKLEKLPRIGMKYGAILKKLNIETVEDFLLHFPFRYEDYSERILIENLAAGETATVMGEVVQSKLVRTWKKKMMITECFVSDETGTVRAVWFNQPYVSDSLTAGKGVRLAGKISEDAKGLFFSNPAWELSSRTPTNTGRLVPIYPETEGLTSKWIRWQMQNMIKYADALVDPIPENILRGLHLPILSEAVKSLHFPKTLKEFELAQKRFAFQQMFLVQLATQRVKISWDKQNAASIAFNETLTKYFVESLPFTLTDAQRKAAFQILKDLEKPLPMNRLLNGDVGSGKTIVAAMASLSAINAGFQVSLMAPTEVLARQHFESISKIFSKQDITVGLLTNSYQITTDNRQLTTNNKKSRDALLQKLKNGEINLVIGTHALIQKDIKFKNLALIIIDEQHRFGVAQRAFLQQQIAEINDGLPGKIPHLLTMTATPIPRTLTLAFFGNLDISVLDEMPKNRLPIVTEIVMPSKRKDVYDFVRSEITKGHQAFIIFPLVEESEKLTELKAATQEHEMLSREIFPDLKLGLLHGKLKAGEKEQVMADFKDKKYDILVATSVVEVGIDIPNATVIMIEDAERFGLSQLHQFRGRVGRSDKQSYCFLFTGSKTIKAKSRLGAMEKTSSGFAIAEEDLKLRGPGEFLGTRQSGLPDIAMEHLSNVKLIEIAHDYAEQTLQNSPDLSDYPLLQKELGKFQSNVHLE